MSLLGYDLNDGTGSFQDKIRNPFEKSVNAPFRGADFPEGFIIEELDNLNNTIKTTVKLAGNSMPKIPFSFGGEQRIKKDFYSGHPEPVMQILGPSESDMEIRGDLKDRRFKDQKFYGISTEIQELIDSIRIRGNLCRFRLGEWQRYGFIEKTDFDMKKLSELSYRVALSIVGFNAPTNAKFLERSREIPFNINKELIDEAAAFQEEFTAIPDSVPRSIGDIINDLTNTVATAIKLVTDFVDTIFGVIDDIKKAIDRAKGLIKHVMNKLREYKNRIGSIEHFDPNLSLTSRYINASFYTAAITSAYSLGSLMNRFRAQFSNLANDFPLARHLIRTGDTLQKISTKFYNTPDNWVEVQDFNKLTTTALVTGDILDIPRL